MIPSIREKGKQMTKTKLSAAALVAALTLSGCVSGQAEFAPIDGKLSAARLTRAQATCRMRARDQVNMQVATGQFVVPNAIVDDAKDCYASQGIQVKGFRQKDGTLTKYPYKGGKPAGGQP